MKHWNAFATVNWYATGSRQMLNGLQGYSIYVWFLRTAFGRAPELWQAEG